MRAKSIDDVLLAYHQALKERDALTDELGRCAKRTAEVQTKLADVLRVARELRAEVVSLGFATDTETANDNGSTPTKGTVAA